MAFPKRGSEQQEDGRLWVLGKEGTVQNGGKGKTGEARKPTSGLPGISLPAPSDTQLIF